MGDESKTAARPPQALPPNFLSLCDLRARKIVCAQAYNDKTKRDEIAGFKFNPAIADWPVCRQAEEEGWARELRGAMIATLKRMMFNFEEPDLARAVHMILNAKTGAPGETWEAATRAQARRFALAKEWRERAVEECGSVERFIALKRLSGSSVATARQRRSAGGTFSSLSSVSLRMTGERAE